MILGQCYMGFIQFSRKQSDETRKCEGGYGGHLVLAALAAINERSVSNVKVH